MTTTAKTTTTPQIAATPPTTATPATGVPGPATRRRIPHTLRRFEQTTRPLVALAVLLGLWQAAVHILRIEPFLLPAPADVAAAARNHLPHLAHQTWVTLGHILGGYLIAAVGALTLAAAMSLSSYLRDAALPLLVAVQAVPKVALTPLLIIYLGFDAASKVALVALLCFFPVLAGTITGLRATPADIIDLTRSLNAGRWTTLRLIRIHYALPHIFTGLKIAMTLAPIGAVVAQMTNPNSGLGAVILRATQQGNMALTFAAITALATTAITLNYTLTAAERLCLPWSRATTA